MSILIKGFKMPTSCDNCWALDDYGDYPRCRITEEQRGYNFPIREKRMDYCPLAPVPPHGDLIDRDDLKNKEITIDYDEWDDTFDDGLLFVTDLIDNAPTIIEAEEGEE